MDGHKCVRVIITGIVQGVGFRWRGRQTAMALEVRGWIRNRPDGSVEAVLQGPSDLVDEMLDWISKGPPEQSSGVSLPLPAKRTRTFLIS